MLDVNVERRTVARVLRAALARRVLESDLGDLRDPVRPEPSGDAASEIEVDVELGEQAEGERLAREEIRRETILVDLLARAGTHCFDLSPGRSECGGPHEVRPRLLGELFREARAKRDARSSFSAQKSAFLPPEGLKKPCTSLERVVRRHEDVMAFEHVVGDFVHLRHRTAHLSVGAVRSLLARLAIIRQPRDASPPCDRELMARFTPLGPANFTSRKASIDAEGNARGHADRFWGVGACVPVSRERRPRVVTGCEGNHFHRDRRAPCHFAKKGRFADAYREETKRVETSGTLDVSDSWSELGKTKMRALSSARARA